MTIKCILNYYLNSHETNSCYDHNTFVVLFVGIWLIFFQLIIYYHKIGKSELFGSVCILYVLEDGLIYVSL